MKIVIGLISLFLFGFYGVAAQPSEDIIGNLSISPNGNMIAVGTLSGKIILLDRWTRIPLITLQSLGKGITKLSWSADSSKLATANFSGVVQAWNVISSQKMFEVDLRDNHLVGITEIVWQPQGNYIAIAAQNDSAYILDAVDGHIVSKLPTKETYDISWNSDGFLITSSLTGLNMWDSNWNLIKSFRSAMGFPGNLAFSPDESQFMVIYSSTDTTVYPTITSHNLVVFDSITGQLMSSFPIVTNYGIFDILWSPNNRFIAIGSQDGVLQIRDTIDGALIDIFTSPVQMMAFDWLNDTTLIYDSQQEELNTFQVNPLVPPTPTPTRTPTPVPPTLTPVPPTPTPIRTPTSTNTPTSTPTPDPNPCDGSAAVPGLGWIVYTSGSDTDRSLYAARPEGTTLPISPEDPTALRLTCRGVGFQDIQPAWSPNRTMIAFVRTDLSTGNDDIWLMNVNNPVGAAPFSAINTANNEGAPTWSPDGQWLAYASNEGGDGDIYAVNISTGARVNLTSAGTFNEGQPDWSPMVGDNRIAYISDRTGSTQVFTNVINVGVSPATFTGRVQITTISQVNNLLVTYRAPKWSPNGSLLAFSGNRRDRTDFDVWYVPYSNGAWGAEVNWTGGRFSTDDEFVAWDPQHIQNINQYRIAFTSRNEDQTGTREILIRRRWKSGSNPDVFSQTTVKPGWTNPINGERNPDW